MSTGPLDPLSPRAEEMLGTLSAYEQDDASVVAVMRAGADELDGVVDLAETVRDQAWPHRANDDYGLLSIHEQMLKLTPEPDAPLSQRQAAVKAAVQARKSGAKSLWVSRMNTMMRGQQWTYEENTPGPGQLTIRIPFDPNTYSSAQVEALARRITPAHIQIILAYSQGFLVGISRVGRDAL
jgi:uncharacterized protein YmfQ (DUF2313 family)